MGKGPLNNQRGRIIFLSEVYYAMITHCLGQNPLEACGLLSGIDYVACTYWPMTNILQSPTQFQMDDQQIEDVFQKIRDKGEQLIGISHSHPTGLPFPSIEDVIHASYPEVVYTIVALAQTKPEVACFRIRQSKVTPVPFDVQVQ